MYILFAFKHNYITTMPYQFLTSQYAIILGCCALNIFISAIMIKGFVNHVLNTIFHNCSHFFSYITKHSCKNKYLHKLTMSV